MKFLEFAGGNYSHLTLCQAEVRKVQSEVIWLIDASISFSQQATGIALQTLDNYIRGAESDVSSLFLGEAYQEKQRWLSVSAATVQLDVTERRLLFSVVRSVHRRGHHSGERNLHEF